MSAGHESKRDKADDESAGRDMPEAELFGAQPNPEQLEKKMPSGDHAGNLFAVASGRER